MKAERSGSYDVDSLVKEVIIPKDQSMVNIGVRKRRFED